MQHALKLESVCDGVVFLYMLLGFMPHLFHRFFEIILHSPIIVPPFWSIDFYFTFFTALLFGTFTLKICTFC